MCAEQSVRNRIPLNTYTCQKCPVDMSQIVPLLRGNSASGLPRKNTYCRKDPLKPALAWLLQGRASGLRPWLFVFLCHPQHPHLKEIFLFGQLLGRVFFCLQRGWGSQSADLPNSMPLWLLLSSLRLLFALNSPPWDYSFFSPGLSEPLSYSLDTASHTWSKAVTKL